MHFVGKLTRLEEDDYYNDDTNIDDIDEKFAVPEEIICFLESKNGDRETSNLLQNGHWFYIRNELKWHKR